MPQFSRQRHALLYLAIIVSTVAVFVSDAFTPLGVAVWILYLVPLAISLFAPRPLVPIAAASVNTLLIAIGALISAGTATRFTAFNRSVGVVTVWILAYAGYFYIKSRIQLERAAWLQAGQMKASAAMRGAPSLTDLSAGVLRAVIAHTDAKVGVIYLIDSGHLQRLATWALPENGAPETIAIGTGLAGQAVVEQHALVARDLPANYLRIGSGLGEGDSSHVIAAPLTADGEVIGVIEIGFAGSQADVDRAVELLSAAAESIGMALRSAQYRGRLEHLLEETQHQAEELQVQQEELRVSNEELEERGRALMDSQARLETQQAELEQTNVQLEEHAQRLEQQKQHLLDAQADLTENTLALERANQYKSEFLANMSHELRTPLNSSLILAKLLQDNKPGNLSPEQVRYASTIYSANTDLLSLINDILDLAKVEAGHMEVDAEPISIDAIVQSLLLTFEPIANEKHLGLRVDRANEAPISITTDHQRLLQILKNLLSNAFKFTSEGEVVLRILPAPPAHVRFSVEDSGIGIAPQHLNAIFDAFRQADGTTSRKYGGSGLGLSISREFAGLLGGDIEVSSQVDRGSIFTLTLPLTYTSDSKAPDGATDAMAAPRAIGTSGRVGSTSASSGGDQQTISGASPRSAGYASTASTAASTSLRSSAMPTPSASARTDASRPASRTPLKAAPADVDRYRRDEERTASEGNGGSGGDGGNIDTSPSAGARAPARTGIPDDRDKLQREHRLILVIEDDQAFARILYDLAHELDFDCVHAGTGEDGIRLAHELQPSGILLDVGLPDNSGLTVLERLKRDPQTRHLPIHMISVNDHAEAALHLGAIGYSLKPTARDELVHAIERLEARLEQSVRRILVVEDDPTLRENIKLLLDADGIEIEGVGTIADALTKLADTAFDCVVMDLTLPDGSGYDLLKDMAESGPHTYPPVIVYTGRSLTAEEERRLRYYSKSIIIKGAKSPERLLDEVTLFLHSVESDLPPDQQRMLRQARQRDSAFEGRKILLAEDDVRNIFALSHVIEPLGATLEIARNGQEAIDKLERDGDIELVLMDIMMPEMDGLTAMREIRKRPEYERLPIIALTAKAMASDRQRCLEAGANDYISKPIEVEKLLSLCRVWLSH